ncbi:hypothetical protein M569_06301 [Genlisea aurea]|uniref:Uncharacterized protein n=1 Tax=Genlisea aurea TaxID=192259 RepID=S8CUB4_9LAMI|nr:hypothetical protein M569_06301 [Genlisea aurea]
MVINGADSVGSLRMHASAKREDIGQQAYTGDKEGTQDLQEVCFNGKSAISQRSLLEGKKEAYPLNGTGEMEIGVVKTQKVDCVSEIVHEKESGNACSDMQMDEFGNCGELPVDDDLFIHDFSEVLNTCMSVDMTSESLEDGEKIDGSHIPTGKPPDEIEHELQLKELEMKKLLQNSCELAMPDRLTANDEIEEGEISAEDWVCNESTNSLPENVLMVEERAGCMVQASENSIQKGKNSDQDSVCEILDDRNNVGSETTDATSCAQQKFGFASLKPLSNNTVESNVNVTMVSHLEESVPSGNIFLQEHATEHQNSITTIEVCIATPMA